MSNTTLKKPLTPLMVDTLMECHERELMQMEPLEASSVPSIAGLVLRKMVEARPFILTTGKKIMAAYLTPTGKRFLNQLMAAK